MKGKLALLLIAIALASSLAIMYWSFHGGAGEARPIRVGYLRGDIHHASYFISKARDSFSRAGLRVEGYEFSAGPEEMEAFRAGELDFGYVGCPPAITAISRGTDVRIIAMVNFEGSSLVVRKDLYEGGLTGIGGLRGKTIAMPLWGSIQSVMLVDLLLKYNITREMVSLQQMPPADMVTLMEAKRIDAFIAWEPFPSLAVYRGVGVKLMESSEIWPNHPCCVLIASRRVMEGDPELVRRFLKVHMETTRFLIDEPESAAKILSKEIRVPEEVILSSFKSIKYSTRPRVDEILKFADILHQLGLIKQKPSAAEIFDLRFYEDLTGERIPLPQRAGA
ncbi:MAG: ABC transporter substrate-binding protein [Candidatus Bathyarchaeia archaeon]